MHILVIFLWFFQGFDLGAGQLKGRSALFSSALEYKPKDSWENEVFTLQYQLSPSPHPYPHREHIWIIFSDAFAF